MKIYLSVPAPWYTSYLQALQFDIIRKWDITCIILWMPLFSMVSIFVDWTKITHSWGSKFVAIVFSYIIHTRNCYLVDTRIRGSDPPRKPLQYPTRIKPSTEPYGTLKFTSFTFWYYLEEEHYAPWRDEQWVLWFPPCTDTNDTSFETSIFGGPVLYEPVNIHSIQCILKWVVWYPQASGEAIKHTTRFIKHRTCRIEYENSFRNLFITWTSTKNQSCHKDNIARRRQPYVNSNNKWPLWFKSQVKDNFF